MIEQQFNFIDPMSHLYRKHRTNTQRIINSNIMENMEKSSSNVKQNSSRSYYSVNKSQTHRSQKQSDNIKKRVKQADNLNQNPVPIAYFFDKNAKKQIIKNIIDTYFDLGPNPESLQTQFKLKNSFHNSNPRANKTCLVIPSKSRILDNKSKQSQPNLIMKNMAKTQQVKFFTHRSLLSQKNKKNLPTILEDIQVGFIKRPTSEQKSRYISPEIALLKRRPSGQQLNKKQVEKTIKVNEKESDLFSEGLDTQLAHSIFFSKTIQNNSKVSSSEGKFYVKKNKYFTLKYPCDPHQSIIKLYNQEGSFLLLRQTKAKKLGAKTLWQAYPYQNQLLLRAHQPLNRQLYQRIGHMHGSQLIYKLYIHSEKYGELFKNNCEWLRDIIMEITRQLLHLQDKVIINKITIDNVCRLGEKDVRIIDWSGCSIREKIVTLDKMQLVKITEPTLREGESNLKKSQRKQFSISSRSKQTNSLKWICEPEYLAPELIQCLQIGSINQQMLWNNSSASDIWSLGCLIFQILTLIPLNAQERYVIKNRLPCRRGIFSMPTFSYLDLLHKQKLFSTQCIRILKKQCKPFLSKIDNRILLAIEKMLVFNKEQRIRPHQLISILSK